MSVPSPVPPPLPPVRVRVPAYVLVPPTPPTPPVITPQTPARRENFPHLPARSPTFAEAREILEALVTHRKTIGLSQKEIARRLKRTPGRMSELESALKDMQRGKFGIARRPRFVTLERYARALGGTLVETPGTSANAGGWKYQPPPTYQPPEDKPQHHTGK